MLPKLIENPTPDPELNAVLHELVTSIQAVSGENFIGAYLQGSFAVGDWDADSDVDFLVAINRDVTDAEIPVLQAMHARIFNLESQWAQHLDGSYCPKEILKREDTTHTPLLYLDNAHDHLVRSDHDNTLVVRWMVRECGVILAGPDPRELIDPIPADDLRREVIATMQDWAEEIFDGRYAINTRWAQPFAVLSYCRMLHTLRTGRIGSKPAGARWAQSFLDPQWGDLVQHAWEDRPNPSLKVQQQADPDEVRRTLEFIRYAIGISQADEMGSM